MAETKQRSSTFYQYIVTLESLDVFEEEFMELIANSENLKQFKGYFEKFRDEIERFNQNSSK